MCDDKNCKNHEHSHATKPTKFKDPVCGMDVTDSIAFKHAGVVYKFCSDHCKEKFAQNPGAFITPHNHE